MDAIVEISTACLRPETDGLRYQASEFCLPKSLQKQFGGIAQHGADADLLKQIVSSNEQAMEVLFARYHKRVARFVLRLVNENALAENIVRKSLSIFGKTQTDSEATVVCRQP